MKYIVLIMLFILAGCSSLKEKDPTELENSEKTVINDENIAAAISAGSTLTMVAMMSYQYCASKDPDNIDMYKSIYRNWDSRN